MTYSKIEQALLNVSNYAAGKKVHTITPVTTTLGIDDAINALYVEIKAKFPKAEEQTLRETVETFFLFSKWSLYKSVYRIDPIFLQVLTETENTVFYESAINSIPVNCFFIAWQQPEQIGLLVYVEKKNDETYFGVTSISDVKGDMLKSANDGMWIFDGEKIEDALHSWMKRINGDTPYDQYYDRAYKNMKTAVQVAYYLSAQNAVMKKVNTPKEKRPKRANGTPLNLRQWEVGYRIGSEYIAPESKKAINPNDDSYENQVVDLRQDRGNGPRPHVRRAHWHHYWAGKGKTQLILKWIAPVLVNGTEDDIVATEHQVL